VNITVHGVNRSVYEMMSAVDREHERDFVMERYKRLHEMDRSFDIAYWQRQGPAAIFEAAWQMVVDVYSPGDPDAIRLDRSVENFQRRH
jgi:hypothetical protein